MGMIFEKLFGERAKDVTPPPSLDEAGKKASAETGAEKLDVKAKAEIDRQFGQIDTQLKKDTFWTKIKNIGTYAGMGALAGVAGGAAWLAFMSGLPLAAGGALAWGALGQFQGVALKRNNDRRLREATASSFYRKESILRRFLKKVF